MSVPTTQCFDADCVGRALPDGADVGGQPPAAGTARPTFGDDVPEPPCFSLAALLRDLRPHDELDLRTLAYHLSQSDATAAEGYWHAAINEARSFLEALLVSILHAVRPDPPDKSHNNGSANGTPFRCYRRSLLETGFIDAHENDLLQYVYGVASAKGSHHGVTNEAWSRLARRMVFTTGQYVIDHYGTWKDGERPRPPDRPDVSRASGNPSWRGWLARVVLRVGDAPTADG